MVVAPEETAPPRWAVLLVNPGARRGGETLDGVLARLREGGVAVREDTLGTPEEIEHKIRRRRQSTAPSSAAGTESLSMAALGQIMATGVALGILLHGHGQRPGPHTRHPGRAIRNERGQQQEERGTGTEPSAPAGLPIGDLV